MFRRAHQTICLLVFLLELVKSLKNLLKIDLLINSKNMVFFLISSTVSSLFDQLQILWQLHHIELLGLLIDLQIFKL